MNAQTLVNSLAYVAQLELQKRPKPARVSLKAQAAKAALAAAHVTALLDSITDPALRQVAATAWAGLEYITTATAAIANRELLQAAQEQVQA